VEVKKSRVVSPGVTTHLSARVINSAGRPLNKIPVAFNGDGSAGLIVGTPTLSSNAQGFVQTDVIVPNTPVTYTVTLSAGTVSTPFTITAASGGPSGSSQFFVVDGDGQLVPEFFTTPLGHRPTVKAVDPAGNPKKDVDVSFAVTAGNGNVTAHTAVPTD